MRAAGAAALTLCMAPGAADEGFPHFEALDHGRTVWLGTCRACHATGFADAPPVTDFARWRERLEQPRSELHRHAIEGFYGTDYAFMPPRGGNAALSDPDVRAAVDYMAALVLHLYQEQQHDTRSD